MTCIAYKDGVMAADTACWGGRDQRTIMFHTNKIQRVSGCLIGLAGTFKLWRPFVVWHEAGELGEFDRSVLKDHEGFEAIVVAPSGLVRIIESTGPFLEYEAPYYVLGTGHEIMVGALEAGASAEEAVRIAVRCTDYGAGTVQVERL